MIFFFLLKEKGLAPYHFKLSVTVSSDVTGKLQALQTVSVSLLSKRLTPKIFHIPNCLSQGSWHSASLTKCCDTVSIPNYISLLTEDMHPYGYKLSVSVFVLLHFTKVCNPVKSTLSRKAYSKHAQ